MMLLGIQRYAGVVDFRTAAGPAAPTRWDSM